MPDDTAQNDIGELERLARARFPDPPLSEAEEKLVRTAPTGEGAVCGPDVSPDDPAYDPSKAEKWGPERQIRAALIRWLCVDRRAKELVDPRGIQVIGASVSDSIDLDNVTIPFRLTLAKCRLTRKLTLRDAQMPVLVLQGSRVRTITADGVIVKGGVFLRNGFHAERAVRFPRARIGGDLDCNGATFENPAQEGGTDSGIALEAGHAVVTGNVFLSNGFSAKGEVRLLGAKIDGVLDCSGAMFENPAQAKGNGNALSADGAVVRGDVFLRNGFSARGSVRLLGAQIEGDLSCRGARISGTLIAQTAVIKGTFFWIETDPKETALDLTNASAGALLDDPGSWPSKGRLILDGFVYGRISGNAPRDVSSRLDWLARQKPFALQPYRQLAEIFRDEGDVSGARKVLLEMERLRRSNQDRRWVARCWGFALRITVGYFYDPGPAAARCLAALILLGTLLYGVGSNKHNIVPTDHDAYSAFETDGKPPAYYGAFNPFVYSFENTFQLAKMGQADRWQPEPSPQRFLMVARHWPLSVAGFLRWFRWSQIMLGWFFTTMLVSGFADIVRKD